MIRRALGDEFAERFCRIYGVKENYEPACDCRLIGHAMKSVVYTACLRTMGRADRA